MFGRLILIAAVLSGGTAWAQISVRLSLERDRYLIYEPLTATVQVDNFGARPVTLKDAEGQPWLRFEILRKDGQRVAMIGPGFLAGSTTLGAGESAAKSANLVSYYNVRELGPYRVRAIVKCAGIGGAFPSNDHVFEVVGGRQLWAKSAGTLTPDGKESLRTFSLMTLRLEPYNRLYARVEDERAGLIFGVISLGPWVTLGAPQAELDKESRLHVLHQVAPRNFRYALISPSGAVLKREQYSDFESRPEMLRAEDGKVKIVGGELVSPAPPSVVPLTREQALEAVKGRQSGAPTKGPAKP